MICLAAVLLSSVASANDLDKIKARFLDAVWTDFSRDSASREAFMSISDHGMANDAVMHQLYVEASLPAAEYERVVGQFDAATCRWRDVDYADMHPGRWHPSLHVMRLCALAKEYTRPGGPHFHDPELGALLHKALKGWYGDTPICPNWWSNEIGIPKRFGAALVMLSDELSTEEYNEGVKVMDRALFDRKTGQNLLWIAGNHIMKGLLTSDYDWVAQMQAKIAGLIAVSDAEGIQKDWSFHQHGHQLQFGNYGLAFLDGIAFWMRVFDGTSLDFTPEQKDIIRNYFQEGISWGFYRGTMDTNFRGRHLFPDSGAGKWLAFNVAKDNFKACGLAGDAEPFGARYFPCSDCGVFRTNNWYASIRMHSRRVIGVEFTNRENMGGQFAADGALLLLQDGPEYDNIFPVWDWRKVPGTTTYEDGKPLRAEDTHRSKLNDSDHVGGLAADDVLCATMELERDGLHAFKSTFFFPGIIVNMGSDIRVSRDEITRVTTAVEQNFLKGEPIVGHQYAKHNKALYYSLDSKPLSVTAGPQSGIWTLMEPSLPPDTVTDNVFKCWIEQDLDVCREGGDTYAYAVIPSCRRIKSPQVKILANTKDCQAIRYAGWVCAVFHQPGSIKVGCKTIEADGPCIIIQKGRLIKTVPLPKPNAR